MLPLLSWIFLVALFMGVLALAYQTGRNAASDALLQAVTVASKKFDVTPPDNSFDGESYAKPTGPIPANLDLCI